MIEELRSTGTVLSEEELDLLRGMVCQSTSSALGQWDTGEMHAVGEILLSSAALGTNPEQLATFLRLPLAFTEEIGRRCVEAGLWGSGVARLQLGHDLMFLWDVLLAADLADATELGDERQYIERTDRKAQERRVAVLHDLLRHP